MTPDDPWLAAVWPFVRGRLPPAPASVVEVGCGTLGGFVPALLDAGYQAVGVDPEAPEGADYRRVEFERFAPPHPVDCVVASLSLHHVADLDAALDRLPVLLAPGGVLVVVEWAWERFDEASARWCFARLAPPADGAEPVWLHHHQERWAASGQPWDAYLRAWASQEGCTRAGRSCEAWIRGSPVGSMPRRRTSSPTWPPPRPRSRPPSTPARSRRAASATPPRGPDQKWIPGCPSPPEGPGAWVAVASYAPLLAWGPLLVVVTVAHYRRRTRTTTDPA